MVSRTAQKNWRDNPPNPPFTIPRGASKPNQFGGNPKNRRHGEYRKVVAPRSNAKLHNWKDSQAYGRYGHVNRCVGNGFTPFGQQPPIPANFHIQQQHSRQVACFGPFPKHQFHPPPFPFPRPLPLPPGHYSPVGIPPPPNTYSPSFQPSYPPFVAPIYSNYLAPTYSEHYFGPSEMASGNYLSGAYPPTDYAFPWIQMGETGGITPGNPQAAQQGNTLAPTTPATPATPVTPITPVIPISTAANPRSVEKDEEKEYKGPLIISSVPSSANRETPSTSSSKQLPQKNNNIISPQGAARLPQIIESPTQGSRSNHTPGAAPKAADSNTALNAISITRSVTIEVPFDRCPKYNQPPNGGVLKIIDIPYNLTKREVVYFMGRDAKLMSEELGPPIHIVMERSTAKTFDCFVEFIDHAAARDALKWVNRCLPVHSPRLGSRHVHVEMSSHDELLQTIFPRAKCVTWKNGMPFVSQNTDPYSTGFQGFLTNEEMYCMIRHAEYPRRAPFSEKCPQRTYEFMITTLYKFPWHATTLYTVEHRNLVFNACYRQLQALVPQVENKRTLGLDGRLVMDLIQAGLRCPAFNERQKYLLQIAASNSPGWKAMPATSTFWPFDTLTRKIDVPEEHVREYAQIIRATAMRKNAETKEMKNNWNYTIHGASPYGAILLEWRREYSNRSWQAAMDYEAKLMNQLVKEGLAALNRTGVNPHA